MARTRSTTLAVVLAATPAAAQESSSRPAADEPPIVDAVGAWTIRFEPSAWFVAPGGEFTIPGSSPGFGRAEELNLDSPRLSPFGEVHVRHERWGFSGSAVAFGVDNRGAVASSAGSVGGIAFASGDELRSSLDFVTAAAAASLQFYRDHLGPMAGGGFRYEPSWDVLVGARVYDVNLDVAVPGGTSSNSAFFAEPYVGLRFSMDLVEQFTIDVQASIGVFSDGGDRHSLSWDIMSGFQWNPTANFGIQFGYRQLAFRLHDGDSGGDFEFNGALAGIYIGGTLRF